MYSMYSWFRNYRILLIMLSQVGNENLYSIKCFQALLSNGKLRTGNANQIKFYRTVAKWLLLSNHVEIILEVAYYKDVNSNLALKVSSNLNYMYINSLILGWTQITSDSLFSFKLISHTTQSNSFSFLSFY